MLVKSFIRIVYPTRLINFDFSVIDDLQPHGMIDNDMWQLLQKDVTRNEISKVLACIKDVKALRAYVFSLLFFKIAWSVVGDNHVRAVYSFFKTNRMLREVNANSITLVPICTTPTTLNDYIPISCFRVVYKCITKILTNRTKYFIPKVAFKSVYFQCGLKHSRQHIILPWTLI